MSNSTSLAGSAHRGRHADAPEVTDAPVAPSPRATPARRTVHDLKLPGMELLGFYDEPFGIHEASAPAPRRLHAPMGTPADVLARTPHYAAPAAAPPRPPIRATVADLWNTTSVDEDTFEGWMPAIIARSKLERQAFSPAFIAACLALAALFSAVLWFVTERPARIEAAEDAAVVASLEGMEATLPGLLEIAATLGDAGQVDISAATGSILAAENDARDLFGAAGTIADEPTRNLYVGLAGTTLDEGQQLSRLVAFRLLAEQVLIPPDLPTSATPEQTAELTSVIATWRADVDASLAELPDDTLPDRATLLAAWAAELEGWQQDYLDAVLLEDPQRQTELVEQQSNRVRRLREELRESLAMTGDGIRNRVLDAATMTGLSVGS